MHTRSLTSPAFAFVALWLAMLIGRLPAQTKPAPPAFENASVRPSDPNSQAWHFDTLPGEALRATGVTLKFLVQMAYDVEDFQVSGGPGWARSERFDIYARPESPGKVNPDQNSAATAEQGEAERLRERMRALLASRFQLKIRQEFKDGSVYFLEQAKSGNKLVPATGGRGIARNRGQISAENASVAMLARTLSATLLRPVLDHTGLQGKYEFKLQWAEAGAPGEPEDSGVSLFTAIQEQLGLRLQSSKGPVRFIIIERVDKPSAN